MNDPYCNVVQLSLLYYLSAVHILMSDYRKIYRTANVLSRKVSCDNSYKTLSRKALLLCSSSDRSIHKFPVLIRHWCPHWVACLIVTRSVLKEYYIARSTKYKDRSPKTKARRPKSILIWASVFGLRDSVFGLSSLSFILWSLAIGLWPGSSLQPLK